MPLASTMRGAFAGEAAFGQAGGIKAFGDGVDLVHALGVAAVARLELGREGRVDGQVCRVAGRERLCRHDGVMRVDLGASVGGDDLDGVAGRGRM